MTYYCTINDPERAAKAIEVYGSAVVPIVSPFPELVELPIGVRVTYLTDLSAITPEQRERLIDQIARDFNVPRQEVVDELDHIGLPVLVKNTTVRPWP